MNFAAKPLFCLVLALTLAGCGVRGALEPPPDSGIKPNANTASATVPATTDPLTGRQIGGQQIGSPAVAGIAGGTTSQAVVNAPAGQRGSILDWLID